jgi:hypothetical protein
MDSMTSSKLHVADRRAREDVADAAARAEVLRKDGTRTLGENLEQADALIRVAFELASGLATPRS